MALDQGSSIRYFGSDLKPYWARNDLSTNEMLVQAATVASALRATAESFDQSLYDTHEKTGGTQYADLTSLVYRQTTGGIEKVWNPVVNETWVFMKEISSDGDVSTIDVLYPACPFFIDQAPETLRRMLLPLLSYANNETATYGLDIQYNLSWAPHHLGTWPVCDLEPMDQEQMPMEESGNLLLMIAAVAKRQGWDADAVGYLAPYLALLNTYADYIVGSLPDPEDQLCTDDFEGASPHNSNLAAKGIVALEAWAEVLMLIEGQEDAAALYSSKAKEFSSDWLELALDPAGDHYKMEYDLDDTFSLKYNLFFQYVLELDGPFDDSVMAMENKFYESQQNTYGVPLDNRADFTKLDWSMWVAAMASDDQFAAITNMTWYWANETTSRVPFSDWTFTSIPEFVGFQARPVMGGLYAKMIMP
uniref:Glutaminase A central domain-containing protein n=1 Tax=Octactis speculum TaxID=3111310 RepID=A0A7S2DPC0_9STRA